MQNLLHFRPHRVQLFASVQNQEHFFFCDSVLHVLRDDVADGNGALNHLFGEQLCSKCRLLVGLLQSFCHSELRDLVFVHFDQVDHFLFT